MGMGKISERIKELEQELRHAKKRNSDIQQKVMQREREIAELQEGAQGVCMMMDAHLAAAAVTYGEQLATTGERVYRLEYPFELVTDGLYKYTVEARREGNNYVVDVRLRELRAE